MTTLKNRPKTALLVIDVQNGVVKGAHERDAVVANVGGLVEKALRERVPVVWVQHSDGQLARGSDDCSTNLNSPTDWVGERAS
jgi:nicotinamidase-related amidase